MSVPWKMTKAEAAAKRLEILTDLRARIPIGSTVYTVLRHVSRSGMQRRISVIIQSPEGPNNISWDMGHLDSIFRLTDQDGVRSLKVDGCGMDMGFEVVYNLGLVLYPDGVPCIGEGCQSNDHNNPKPYGWGLVFRPGELHEDGGYAFRQRWL